MAASPPRIEALPAWTPELVCERMIEAFRQLPKVPVYSPGSNVLKPALYQARPADFDLVAFSAIYLKRNSNERRFLLAWASARAAGRSVREVCREMGWPKTTFFMTRKRACKIIADGLNRDGIPAFWQRSQLSLATGPTPPRRSCQQ